jgi:hypothetical protein
MLAFLADEDFNNDILDGLARRDLSVDILRVQDVDLSGADDPVILEWAALAGRIVLTHDRKSMPTHGSERVARGDPMPGIVAVRKSAPYAMAIEEILLIAHCMSADEINGLTYYVPLL